MHKREDFIDDNGYQTYLKSLKQTQNGWNIADRIKPDSGKIVMIFTVEKTILGTDILLGTYWDDTDDWTVYDFEKTKELRVSHWKELPQPPF